MNSEIQNISARIEFIEKHSDIKGYYESIELDGIVKNKKRNFLIGKRKLNGGFSRQFLVKENNLERVVEVRCELKNEKHIKTINNVRTYIYQENKLIYFFEFNEKVFNDDSTEIDYRIEYFLKNEFILKYNIEGSFNEDKDEYLTKKIVESKSLILDKNEILMRN